MEKKIGSYFLPSGVDALLLLCLAAYATGHGGIIFLSCSSVCACVRAGWQGHSPTG